MQYKTFKEMTRREIRECAELKGVKINNRILEFIFNYPVTRAVLTVRVGVGMMVK